MVEKFCTSEIKKKRYKVCCDWRFIYYSIYSCNKRRYKTEFNSENPTCTPESTFRFRIIKLRIVWTYLCFLFWNLIYISFLININNCTYRNVWRLHICLCFLVLFLLVYLLFIQDFITYFHYLGFSCPLLLAVFVIVFKYFLLLPHRYAD